MTESEKHSSEKIENRLPDGFCVYSLGDDLQERGKQLAMRLGINHTAEVPVPGQVHLRLDEAGLCLTDGRLELRGDLRTMLPRLRQDNLHRELLVKAAKLKGFSGTPIAVDATAGMGEDSLLLAASGFYVRLYEYDMVIASLLEDSLLRAREIPELADAVSRMELHMGDSISALRAMGDMSQKDSRPDVVLLDPMFPERQKSALVKKKFQLLQQLEQPCSEETALLDAAIAACPRRIVIKRPAKGPFLAGKKPSFSQGGKAVRYDCLVLPRQDEQS